MVYDSKRYVKGNVNLIRTHTQPTHILTRIDGVLLYIPTTAKDFVEYEE